MKKIFMYIVTSILLLLSTTTMTGCSMPDDPPIKDYNADIQVILPENIADELFEPQEDTTYYTSPGFSLSISIRGHFMIMDHFSLDGDKRVYENIYLYEDDYFYMVTDDYVDLFASIGDSSDSEYVEEEKASGEDLQINVIKEGIYNIIFDTKTLKFDMVFLNEITTPRYYTIQNCDIYSVATSWTVMSKNPDNQNEFYISNYHIDSGKSISFFSHIHTSNFIPTLDQDSQRMANVRKTDVRIFIGGDYDVFINAKTYEVRLELKNPETADYSCVYYDGDDFIPLELVDNNVPYIFTYQITADTPYNPLTSGNTKLHTLYSENYGEYKLTIINSPDINAYHYCKEKGTYKVTVNLKTFELTAELLPE
ncbi:MAG: hypothetical protein IJW28_01325 [Clostridia bacterium]|nr:hypothetical protein [Clostridia bacterium]